MADSPTVCDDRRNKSAPSGSSRPAVRTRSEGKGSDTVAGDGNWHGIVVISNAEEQPAMRKLETRIAGAASGPLPSRSEWPKQ